jgi:tellurite resistance protein TehA-like permease
LTNGDVCFRWFAINMGTGIVSILLHNLPYNGAWLQYISYVFFALNIALFTVFLVISVLRYTLYPEIWVAMIAHPGQSLFLGCFPMGFASRFFFPTQILAVIACQRDETFNADEIPSNHQHDGVLLCSMG